MAFPKILAVAAAALAMPLTASAKPVIGARAVQTEHPIGHADPSTFKLLSVADAPIPRAVVYSTNDLGNATEAPASDLAVEPTIPSTKDAVPDTRFLHTDTVYPFLSTGKIQWSDGVFCSGALIGPRLVATAKHCTPQDGQQVSIRFSPGFDNGEAHGGAYVTAYITSNTGSSGDCGVKDDWAILVLDSYLGNQFGYFGAAAPVEDQSVGVPMWWTQGYPGDKDNGNRPYATQNVRVTANRNCDVNGPLIADNYVAGGQSGSAFWYYNNDGAPIQHGIASVTAVDHSFSGWASGSDFVNAVISARNDFP